MVNIASLDEVGEAVDHLMYRTIPVYQKFPPLLMEKVIDQVKKACVNRALRHTKGNQCQAALQLGINRNTLRKLIYRYSIDMHKILIEYNS